jgi:hypothetical protein
MHNQTEQEPIKNIARFSDGSTIKGRSPDFSPKKPFFHVYKSIDETAKEGIRVFLAELKAVFFVKSFEGNPSYDERKEFCKEHMIHGKKIEVLFKDGEILVGATTGYDPHREGFFLFPVDPQSNNLRIYIVSAAVKQVRHLPG